MLSKNSNMSKSAPSVVKSCALNQAAMFVTVDIAGVGNTIGIADTITRWMWLTY